MIMAKLPVQLMVCCLTFEVVNFIGVIKGLFFSGRLDKTTGLLPVTSPFSSIRMCIPPNFIFDPNKHNLWFSDFYCHKSITSSVHYVTVVVTVCSQLSD